MISRYSSAVNIIFSYALFCRTLRACYPAFIDLLSVPGTFFLYRTSHGGFLHPSPAGESFMCMDVITKHFGPKASTLISIHAVLINLLTCLIFFVASMIPSNADDYTAFNGIFGGTWFILLGSTVAFLSSALIHNSLNWFIGLAFKKNPHGKAAFAARTYVSSFVGQFSDNFIFSVIVFVFFAPIFWDGFCWTILQCAMCALTGAVAEVIMQIVFSPIGYRITQKWRQENVGKEYFDLMESEKNI